MTNTPKADAFHARAMVAQVDEFPKVIGEAFAIIAELEHGMATHDAVPVEEYAALLKDARRYRWLRDDRSIVCDCFEIDSPDCLKAGADLDTAIDAAMVKHD